MYGGSSLALCYRGACYPFSIVVRRGFFGQVLLTALLTPLTSIFLVILAVISPPWQAIDTGSTRFLIDTINTMPTASTVAARRHCGHLGKQETRGSRATNLSNHRHFSTQSINEVGKSHDSSHPHSSPLSIGNLLHHVNHLKHHLVPFNKQIFTQ